MNIKLALAGIGLSILVAGCSSPEDKMRGQFLSGCAHDGADRAFCGCLYDKLREKFSIEYLEQMNRSGTLTPEFMETGMRAGMQCQNL